MYPKKPNAKFLFLCLQFLGGHSVLSPFDLCLFQIYSKFSQQALYVKLDQFAKGN
jgi:hypothetical protein